MNQIKETGKKNYLELINRLSGWEREDLSADIILYNRHIYKLLFFKIMIPISS